MADSFGSRVKNAWNAFWSRDQTSNKVYRDYGIGYSRRPDRTRLSLGNERSIVAALYNRIAIDVSSIAFQHVRVDQNGRYVETIQSSLNDCLTLSANIDQISRAFFQDAALTLFDDGAIALVPVETSADPDQTGGYDVYQLRVGRIVEWYPKHVRINAYNDRDGRHHEFIMRKDSVAIVENPLYTVMNESNSTLRRLVRKINLLDGVDEQTSSGKLDIIVKLPYAVRSEAKMKLAEERKRQIEEQLAGSKYGIAYVDATESITQLNRAAENNLLGQIEYLTKEVFSQLGATEAVFYGTANEQEMLNYHNRTIEPIVDAFVTAMTRSFLSKTARTQGQRIMYFRDPFKLVPVNQIADIADKFTRNEILSSNEIRAIVGYKPVQDERADELRNKNLNASKDNPAGSGPLATADGEDPSNANQMQLPAEIQQIVNQARQMQQSDNLEHHGTKGQKWGVRNGPPYPIGRGGVDNAQLNPNVKKLSNYNGKMYCISTQQLDGKTLTPRVPDNFLTKNGYEDNETPRVCFAPSVDQCLIGLSQNVTNKTFYVYSPEDISKLDVYKPNVKAVPDSKITGELWAIQPVTLKEVGKIFCEGDAGRDGLEYTYGDGKKAELYEWNYSWKERKKE